MSKLICPFCQRELEQITTSNPLGLGRIEMAVCKKCMDKGVLHIMPIWDWQELIRTHKALDVAVDKLKDIKATYDDSYADPNYVNWHIVAHWLANDADNAIKTITALEQKD